MNPEEHLDDLEYVDDEEHFGDIFSDDEDEEEDPWDLHDYAGESPESLRRWHEGRTL